ncbi:MAG: response regulator, partial [Burkholderiaceae bacterium]|nr:response regulator [Burkholderiaceae bacterium]
VGRRDDPIRTQDDLLLSQFTATVLKILNGMVEAFFIDTREFSAQGAKPDGAQFLDQFGTRRPRALVVDDSPTVRRQLTVALHQMGVDCDAMASGREALAALVERGYEVALIDVMMPGLDGFALTREIRRDRAMREVPVVILTSRSSTFDLARGALAGCSSYLVKPVSLRSLRATVARQIRRVVARRRARGQAPYPADNEVGLSP